MPAVETQMLFAAWLASQVFTVYCVVKLRLNGPVLGTTVGVPTPAVPGGELGVCCALGDENGALHAVSPPSVTARSTLVIAAMQLRAEMIPIMCRPPHTGMVAT
jgi:hypothetical protein